MSFVAGGGLLRTLAANPLLTRYAVVSNPPAAMQNLQRCFSTAPAGTDSEVDWKKGSLAVQQLVETAYVVRPLGIQAVKPTLVAVSKYKPAAAIVDVYKTGVRHFGENYVQELIEKGTSRFVRDQCPDIRWHFIGHLQTNKINKLLKVPNLYMIESVDSKPLATALNDAWGRIRSGDTTKLNAADEDAETVPRNALPAHAENRLRVLVQVNTSNELDKSGCELDSAVLLVVHIVRECPNLQFCGLMTIGKPGHDYATGPNQDFVRLLEVLHGGAEFLHYVPRDVHMSMGMSNDYERAIEVGATIVRVGTAIFGFRPQRLPESLQPIPPSHIRSGSGSGASSTEN